MSNQMISVLLVEPGKKAQEALIDGSLKGLQAVVGGTIQAVYPFDEQVALVCNDEGKIYGLPLNRALYDNTGKMYDIVAGTFFICGLNEDSFDSLSAKQMEQFMCKFQYPNLFIRLNGNLTAIEVDEAYFYKDSTSVDCGLDIPEGR
jgi:hypothetical protein